MVDPHLATPSGRVRARGIGIHLAGRPGPVNAITDVPGLEVGYSTIIQDRAWGRPGTGPACTGVTAIVPCGRADAARPCTAGWYSLNGNGEMTGTSWIEESGLFTGPMAITNTHAVGTVHRAIIDWAVEHRPDDVEAWILPVVAETWDGYLNDIAAPHVTAPHVFDAIDGARAGPIEQGTVGGGTGMRCYGFKGGSGSASRVVEAAGAPWTVGAFVQANFGSRPELTVSGVPVGSRMDAPPATTWTGAPPPGAGSIIVVVATDAPLLPGQCKALARRVPLGIARTGSTSHHTSGDIFLAFSTARQPRLAPVGTMPGQLDGYDELRVLPWHEIDPLYGGVVQAVEEAIIDALVTATAVDSGGRLLPALPHGQLLQIMRDHRAL